MFQEYDNCNFYAVVKAHRGKQRHASIENCMLQKIDAVDRYFSLKAARLQWRLEFAFYDVCVT